MTEDDKKFMGMALERAKFFLEKDQFPVGAVVVLDGQVIGESNEEICANRRFNHAERVALHQATRDKKDTELNLREVVVYTTLEPCIMCFGMILHSRIRRVVYALEDPFGGATDLNMSSMLPTCCRTWLLEIRGGVMREESRQLIKQFLTTTKDEYWISNTRSPLYKICMI